MLEVFVLLCTDQDWGRTNAAAMTAGDYKISAFHKMNYVENLNTILNFFFYFTLTELNGSPYPLGKRPSCNSLWPVVGSSRVTAIGRHRLWVVLLLYLVGMVTLVRVWLLAVAGLGSHGGAGEVLVDSGGVVTVWRARLRRLRRTPHTRDH